MNNEVRRQADEKGRAALEKKREFNIEQREEQIKQQQTEKDAAIKKELKELDNPSININERIQNYNNLKKRSRESPLLLTEINVNFCDFITIPYINNDLPFQGTGITESSGYTTNYITSYFFKGMGHCYAFIFILKDRSSDYYMHHWFFQEPKSVIEILNEKNIYKTNIEKILTFSQYKMPTDLCIQLIQLSNNKVINYFVDTPILTIDIKVFNVPITSELHVKCRETDSY